MHGVFASLVAFGLLLTSPVTGRLSYLCQMDGLVHSECCCPDSDVRGETGASQIQSANTCCETKLTDASRLPATAEPSKLQLPPVPAVAIVSILAPITRPASEIVVRRTNARGPPPSRGVPLFVQHCSYLI